MGCCYDADSYVSPVIKYLVFTFNFLFWLIGIAFIVVGLWAFHEKTKFDDILDLEFYDIVFDLSIAVILIGVVVFMVASCGFVGALRENICLLRAFSFSLAALLLCELTLAILAFVFSNQLKAAITKVAMTEGLERYRDDPDLKNFIDWIQQTFMCCGIGRDGFKDWSFNKYFNCTDDNPSAERCGVPYSCCLQPEPADGKVKVSAVCGYGTQNLNTVEAQEYIYTSGCLDAILSHAKGNLYIIGVLFIAFIIPQALGIAFGCCLVRDIGMELGWLSRK